MGLDITFNCGDRSLGGYLALPDKKEGPGLILLQEWWGINTHIKDLVDRFASAGFVTLAPDLFHGEVATTPDAAERAMMQLNISATAKELECAVTYLKEQKVLKPQKIAVMGFCMGGQLALFTASISKDIDACIDFYGIHPNVKPDFHNISCPVLGIFGGLDTMVTPSVVQELETTLDDHKISHTFITYEKAGHAFFNDGRKEVYNKAAAEDAYQQVLTFLKRTIT